MATQDVTITLNTPVGVTVASALDVLSKHYGYDAASGLTKAQYIRFYIARRVEQDLKNAAAEAARIAAYAASQTTVS